jgi:hypothetical protein
MHGHAAPQPKSFNLFLVISWMLALAIFGTLMLGFAGYFDPIWTLGAVMLCAPPAFILMLWADKVSIDF